MIQITLQEVYLYAKIIGSISAVLATGYGIFKYFLAVYKQRESIDNTVQMLATNHLPHIKKSLDDQDIVLRSLTSDVRNIGTKVDAVEQRVDDTKTSLDTLNTAFLRHLDKNQESIVVTVERKPSELKEKEVINA